MDDKKKQQDKESNDIKRELDKNKTLNDPGSDVVDYGRSEQAAAEESKKEKNQGADNSRV